MNTIYRLFAKLMDMEDSYHRQVLFTDRLKKGDTPEHASVFVLHAMFDYST